MRPAVAIEELTKLKAEAESADLFRQPVGLESWKPRVRMILVRSLGADNHVVDKFDKVAYSPSVMWGGMPRSAWEDHRRGGVRNAIGLIDAAIYELKFVGGDEPVDEHAYDPELWAHVKALVESEQWGMVASQTAIFVENHVRGWTGYVQDERGEHLIGRKLYLAAFGEDSEYRMGAQAGEREGWRFLGMGFAQALGNVDRHRIQKREDAKRYALGVLGLGSLLLTQLRYEHGDILKTE